MATKMPRLGTTRRRAVVRQINVGIFGTFDVRNYGDLLFPIIAQKELSSRDERMKVVPYSYNAMNRNDWFYPVKAVTQVDSDMDNLSAFMIGGGHLLRFDENVALNYFPPNDTVTHPTGYWLAPALTAISAGRPLIWNAPSSSYEFANWGKGFVPFVLANSAYVAFRDEESAETVRKYGYQGQIDVVPDTAFGLGRFFSIKGLWTRSSRLLKAIALTRPYYIVQANEHCVDLWREVQSRDPTAAWLMIEVSPALGESRANCDLQGECKCFSQWPSPLDLAALVASSSGVVCSSLHLSITAICYGKPSLRPETHKIGKYGTLQQFESVFWGKGENEVAKFLSWHGRTDRRLAGQEEGVKRHWDKVYDSILERRVSDAARNGARYSTCDQLLRAVQSSVVPIEEKIAEIQGQSINTAKVLNDEKESLSGTVAALTQELRNGDDELARLRGECKSLERLAEENKAEATAALAEGARLASDLRDAEADASRLTEQVRRDDSKLKSLEQSVASLPNKEAQIDSLVGEGKRLALELATMRSESATLRAQVDAVLTKLNVADAKQARMEGDLSAKAAEHDSERILRLGAEATLMRLENEAATGLVERQRLCKLLAAAQLEVAEAGQRLEVQSLQMASEQIAREMVERKTTELEEQIGYSNGQLEALRRERELQTRTNKTLQETVWVLQDRLSKSLQQASFLSDEIGRYEQQHRNLEIELEAKSDLIQGFDRKIKSLTNELSDAGRLLIATESYASKIVREFAIQAPEIRRLSIENERLQAMNSALGQSNEQLEGTVRALESDRNTLTDSMKGLERLFSLERERASTTISKFAELHSKVASARFTLGAAFWRLQELSSVINDSNADSLEALAGVQSGLVQELSRFCGISYLFSVRDQVGEQSLVRAVNESRFGYELAALRRNGLITRGWRERFAVALSGLFDPKWYLAQNPDVAGFRGGPLGHFMQYGGKECRDPGPLFSSRQYWIEHSDVKKAGINPLVHFLLYGVRERRVVAASRNRDDN
jgi:hypothetical protein